MSMNYLFKVAEETARAVVVAVGTYLVMSITAGGVPTTQQGVIAVLAGAVPVAYAALRAAITGLRKPPPGAGVLKFPTATSAAKATLHTRAGSTLVNYIAVFSGSVGVAAQPGAGQIALLSDGVQGTTQRYVRIGNVGATDTKIRIYDKAGTLVLTSATSVPIAGKLSFVISFDGVNGVGGVYIKLYINGVEDGAVQTAISAANFFDTTKYMFWGEWLAAATNRGADMFLDDIAVRRSLACSRISQAITAAAAAI